MKFTDTHSHIYDLAFDNDRDEVFARALGAGVDRLFLPAVDNESNQAMFELANRYPANCLPMIGLHPTSVNDNPDYLRELELVEEYLKNPPVQKFYAIGEVGLDLYWSKEWQKQQREAFGRQVELAIEYSLPLVIHTRDAWDEMTELLCSYKGAGLSGVMHAFSGSEEHYRRIIEVGDFVFGIGGVVTYKRSSIADILPLISLNDIVLETDSPYLTPVPHRGKRNESSYIPIIAAKVAQLLDVSIEEVAQRTNENSKRIFKV